MGTLKLLRLSLQLRSSVKQTITYLRIHTRIEEEEKDERGKERKRKRSG